MLVFKVILLRLNFTLVFVFPRAAVLNQTSARWDQISLCFCLLCAVSLC